MVALLRASGVLGLHTFDGSQQVPTLPVGAERRLCVDRGGWAFCRFPVFRHRLSNDRDKRVDEFGPFGLRDQAPDFIGDKVPGATRIGPDHRGATGHTFDEHQTERFVPRRVDPDVCDAVEHGDLRLRSRSEKVGPLQAEFVVGEPMMMLDGIVRP